MVPRKRRTDLNSYQRPSVDLTPNPYVTVVLEVIHRAVLDASGRVDLPGKSSPEKIEAEAKRWLADTQAVQDLIELAGYDSGPVLARIRQGLSAPGH
jgi:hypothetical protein